MTPPFDCAIVSKVLITLQKYQNQIKTLQTCIKVAAIKILKFFAEKKMSQKSLKTYLIECETIEIWDRLEL